MMNSTLKILPFKAHLLLFLLAGSSVVYGQKSDTLKSIGNFSGAVTVTTKGLSTFPNLTLGKPAAILDLSMGGAKFRFEPVFRFALEGKPWSFIFWCRYELMNNEKFQLKLGAHPAYSFKTIIVTQNETTKEILRAQQYFAGELSPTFKVRKNISLGPYYIHAWGLEKDIVQNSDFISFRANFSSISLSDKYFMKLAAASLFSETGCSTRVLCEFNTFFKPTEFSVFNIFNCQSKNSFNHSR